MDNQPQVQFQPQPQVEPPMQPERQTASENRQNNGKSTIVITILTVLLLAMSGLAGYLWFNRPAEKSVSNQDNTSTSQGATNNSAAEGQTPSSVEYVSLPFMGVKYVKTDNQKYVVTSIEKVDGNMVAYFTSSAHADICGTKDMYAGLISRSANPAFGIPEEKQKKIGEYWYAFSPPQAYNCEDMTLKYNETDIVSKEIFGTLQAE